MQTTYFRPTIVAGTRQKRSFSRGFGHFPFAYRTALQIYNRSSTTVILYIDGEEKRRVAPGDLGIYDEDHAIPYYELDAVANTNANEVEVHEDGGLDQSLDQQLRDQRVVKVENASSVEG